MASTTFQDRQTPIMADWLNDVDTATYRKNTDCIYLTEYTTGTDSQKIKQAITDASTQKKKLVIPTGTYSIDTVINPTLTNSFEVECEIGAEFVATAGLNNRLFFFSKISGSDITMKWSGGKCNMEAVSLGGSGTAWDHFYIGEKFEDVTIDNVVFYSGTDYTTNHGDSGIFCVAKKVSVDNCRFIGIWDSAIYLSADSSEANGESAVITRCKFIKCSVGVISKRQFLRYVVTNNFFDRNVTAIATGEADTTLLAGKQNIIANNHIVQPKACGIQVAIADSTIVTGNRIEDQGYDLSDVATSSSFGIALKGSSNCVVSNNIISMLRFTTPSTSHRGIQLERRTYNSVDYDCEQNLISSNEVNGVSQGIREDDSNQNFNRIVNNIVTGATSISIKSGAGSYWEEFDNKTQGRKAFVGTVSLGGNFNSESFRVTPVSGAVDFIAATGSTSGSPTLTATGASTDIDFRLVTTGAGVLRFGTLTASADAPVSGYITIKDNANIVRKLAVIS